MTPAREALLHGVRVIDLAGEPAAMAGRILADLGAQVVKVERPDGDPLRSAPPFAAGSRVDAISLRFAAWSAGKLALRLAAGDPRLERLLAGADLVIDTPGWPGVHEIEPERAPQATWVHVTPFGGDGPRARWQASDLGVMASSGNMYLTGHPDRAPVRCTEPSGYAHAGPEAALAALTALASGRRQIVDLSMQEVVLVSNMSRSTEFPRSGDRGSRIGASIMGKTREFWPCKDGYVSFGLRGGRARIPSLQALARLLDQAGLLTPAWDRDWTPFNPNTMSESELRLLEEPLAQYFSQHTMAELYETACKTNLMLASANSPREIYGSAQLAAREMFRSYEGLEGFPVRFAVARSAGDRVAPIGASPADRPATAAEKGEGVPAWEPRSVSPAPRSGGACFEGVKIVEFGAGAAGPIATRYFAEHGATVVKVEAKGRPEFLRMMAVDEGRPHGLEGSALFNSLNAGKRSITINLKHPEGIEIARRLVFWADAVLENFAPRAMRGFGLDYDTLAAEKPDLVMVSSCLNGQTGPHRNYSGFGAQGSALAGFNVLTGWPDREPVGPYGTITDSLAPRFAATALAAGLLYRRRTGRGVYVDLAQVEAALYTLAPWLLDYANNGVVTERMGNRSTRAVPHGAFPCRGEDRWVAIAAWDDASWARLAGILGLDEPGLATLPERQARVNEVEARVADWTAARTREEVAERLQGAGIEAVPVSDLADLHDDPQLARRGHFVPLAHSVIGECLYERNGFRLSDSPGGYTRPAPALGEHSREVLRDLLGIPADECARLEAAGGLD